MNTTTQPRNDKRIKLQSYIIDSIDCSGYDKPSATLKDQISIIVDEFNNAMIYPNNLKRINMGLATVESLFIDFLQGLPTCLNIDFYYHKIDELMNSFGYDIEGIESQENSKLFYSLVYREFCLLCTLNKVALIK